MKTQTNTPNMETGSIPRLLAQLAIPAVVAQIINLLYNIVDRIYIGHIPGIGAAALTGVLTSARSTLLYAMVTSFKACRTDLPRYHTFLPLQIGRASCRERV